MSDPVEDAVRRMLGKSPGQGGEKTVITDEDSLIIREWYWWSVATAGVGGLGGGLAVASWWTWLFGQGGMAASMILALLCGVATIILGRKAASYIG